MLIAPKQNGFVMISVLLITTISTVIAAIAVEESRLQERISGNQAKEINARAKAEQGLFNSHQYIEAQSNSFSADEIRQTIHSQSISGEYTLTAELGSSSNVLVITSQGEYQGANAYLKSEMLIGSGSVNSDDAGVVACEGISLSGSGLIDSFDSTQGSYDANNANSNASVITIDGDIKSTGGINVAGDLTVNGDFNQVGSAIFTGDLSVSGNATLQNSTVAGNLSSGNNISLAGVTVGDGTADSGSVSSIGSLELSWGNGYTNSEDGIGTGAVNANGGLITPNNYNLSSFSNDISEFGAIAPTMSSNECNQKDIANAFPTVNNSDINSHMSAGNTGGSQAVLAFNETTATVFSRNGGTTTISPSLQSSTLWDGEQSVYVFDAFNLNNTMITISGDVVIMLTGDLTTAGGDTGFQFAEGDTNSSLTILVEGQVSLGSSVVAFPGATIDATSQKVPLTIYSSFDSEANADANAVYLNGESSMYAQVYAPLGDVDYAASGQLMGSLEGRNITISGDGDIHYDEALANIGDAASSTINTVTFVSLYYHYPD